MLNGSVWFRLAHNIPTWFGMAEDGPEWFEMVQNGQEWSRLVQIGPECPRKAQIKEAIFEDENLQLTGYTKCELSAFEGELF